MKKVFLSAAVVGLLFTACNDAKEEAKQEEGAAITTDVVNNPNTASEAPEAASEDVPKMVFAEELYDFGSVSQGEKVQYSYEFKNEGKTDLIITSAKGSCGCTVPSWPKEPIAPGASGKIDVVFDSNGKSGKQHKKVTIVANTMPATNVVALKGEVIAPENPAQ